MRALWNLGIAFGALALAACGARTPLGGGNASPDDDADAGPPLPCNELPWIVFDVTGKLPGGGPATTTAIAAMRLDGSDRHVLAPMLQTRASFSPSLAPDAKSFLYVSSHGPYELRRFTFASADDRVVFGRKGSLTSVGVGVESATGTIAFADWIHLTLAARDGSNAHSIDDDCTDCIPVAFGDDSLFLYDHRSLDTLSLDGTKRAHLLGPVVAPPALTADRRRAAAVVRCGNDTSLRIFDLDPGGAFVATCDGGVPRGTRVAFFAANFTRVAWSASDWIVLDVDGELVLISPERTLTHLPRGDAWRAFQPTFAPGCVKMPAGPPL